MYIELVSKVTRWQGEKGVVIDIKGRTYPSDPNTMTPQDGLNTTNARKDIGIIISGLGEVSSIYLGNPTWYGPRPIHEDSLEEVHQWLEDKGLLPEWREETAKYIKALSRVNLAISAEDTGADYLVYRLKMCHGGMVIGLTVMVYEDKAMVSIYLRDGEDKYECDRVKLGECTIGWRVTTHTLKAEVRRFLDKLWDLLHQPMVAD